MYANGDVYEGNWVNNMRNGFGVYVTVNEGRYEGMWFENKMKGLGTKKFQDCSEY